MSVNWSLYENRLNVGGTTKTERNVNRIKTNIVDKTDGNPSYKAVTINSNTTTQTLLINEATKGNVKEILSLPNETFSLGDYVYWNNKTWLIIDCDTDNTIQIKGKMEKCNWVLKFQRLTDYSIVSVPCITSGKTFDADESKTINLGANKKSLLLPKNVDTLTLKTDRRVYIDTRNETPYKLLDPDTTSYNYGENGLIYIIGVQDTSQNTTTYPDKPDLGICNYREPIVVPPVPVGETYSEIKVSGEIYINGRQRTMTATPYKADKTVDTGVNLIWSFVKPVGYESLVVTVESGNTCTIKVLNTDDYNKLIGKIVIANVVDSSGGHVGTLSMKIKMT